MGRPGRKSKAGKRYRSGKLKPQAVPTSPHDRGSEWVQRQRERFGEHYSSALGRAYAGGLLGDGDDAKRLYDAGKRFARSYNRVFGTQVYRCPLNDTPRGLSLASPDPDREEREMLEKQWLFSIMDSLDVDGSRPWLDQLIHALYTDTGPLWLDRLLSGGRDPVDQMMLKAAIAALDIIAPEKRTGRILVA